MESNFGRNILEQQRRIADEGLVYLRFMTISLNDISHPDGFFIKCLGTVIE